MSDDDFKVVGRDRKLTVSPKRNPGPEGTLFIVESKWKGSDILEQLSKYFETSKLTNIKIIFVNNRLSSYHPDFEFPDVGSLKGLSMLLLTETDYIGQSTTYKQRVAKFYSLRKDYRAIIFCVRTQLSASDFLQVQIFVSVEIGLTLIPVSDLDKIPQLVAQLYIVEKGAKGKINPFKFGSGIRHATSSQTQFLTTLMSIPGLGDKKARALIDSGRFQSLVDLSEASLIDLKSVLDANSARSVHGFFNMEN